MSGTWFNEALNEAVRRRSGQSEHPSPDVERGGGTYPPHGLPESFGPSHPPPGGSEEELIPAMESLGRTTGGLGDPFVTGVVTGGLGDPAFVTQAVVSGVSGDQSSVSQHTGPPSQVFHSVPGSQGSQVNTTSGSVVSVGGLAGPSVPTGSLPNLPSFSGVPVQQFFPSMPGGVSPPVFPVWPGPAPSNGPRQASVESSGNSEQLMVRAIQAMQAQTEVLTNTVSQVLQAQSAQFQQLMGLLSMQQAQQAPNAVGAAPVPEGTAVPNGSVPYTRLAGRTPPPPPPVGAGTENSSVFKNVDSKLLPPMPTVDVNKWSTRPQEIVGFQTYLESLSAWLCVLQPVYGTELREALKRSTPVPEEKFTTQQQERSTRLFYILKQSLGSSARCQALIRIFEYEHDQKTQGYELARRLKEEFSIITRAEALHFRNQLLSYRVKGGLSLKDLVHTMDAELLMFDRILNCSTDSSLIAELKISEPDKFRWILLNLERYGDCKRYCQLHSVGETYAHVKQAILDFHQRTVLNSQDFRTVNQPLSAFGNQGSQSRHTSQEKYPHIECWKCGRKGHYARNCRSDGVSPARSGASGSSGRSKGHRKGTNSGSPDHRKGSGKESKEEKSKGKGKKGEKDKGKGKKGKGKAGVRAAEYQEASVENEGLESEGYEAEASEEVWSEAGDLTELRLSMFVRSQSHDVKQAESLQELFVRSEPSQEDRKACCEQVGCRSACFEQVETQNACFGHVGTRDAVFVEQSERLTHEAASLAPTGVEFGPSERQKTAENRSSRRRSWASLVSEEAREVELEGQPPQLVQPIAPRPDVVRFDGGTRFAGTRFAGPIPGLRLEVDGSHLGKLVECRSLFRWTAQPTGRFERLCQPWRVEGSKNSDLCDSCGVVAPVKPFCSHASNQGNQKNAVTKASSLLFCNSCCNVDRSHARSLREFRKHLSKSRKGHLLEPALMHGQFEQELSTFRKQDVRSPCTSTSFTSARPRLASGWNQIERAEDLSVGPFDLQGPCELEQDKIGDLGNLDKIADEVLAATLDEVVAATLELVSEQESQEFLKCVEQECKEVQSLLTVASLGIRETVSEWSPEFVRWCMGHGKKPKPGLVEASFPRLPGLLVGDTPLMSTAAAIFPLSCSVVRCRDPEPQSVTVGHQKTRPRRSAGPPLWPVRFEAVGPRSCLLNCESFETSFKEFEHPKLESSTCETFEYDAVPVFDVFHSTCVSKEPQLMQPLLQPLFFSNVEDLNLASWWLMDSGASRSVVSNKFLDRYQVEKTRDLEHPLGFSTASGQRVEITREVVIRVQVELYSRDKQVVMPVSIRALVSDVEHNLLSVVEMARKGWEFVVNQKECVVSIGQYKLYPIMWANCPWLKVHEVETQSSSHDSPNRSRRVRVQGPDDQMQVDSLNRSRSLSGTSSHSSHAEGKEAVRTRKASPMKRDQGFTKNGLKVS